MKSLRDLRPMKNRTNAPIRISGGIRGNIPAGHAARPLLTRL